MSIDWTDHGQVHVAVAVNVNVHVNGRLLGDGEI